MARPLEGAVDARRLGGIRLVDMGRRPHGRYGNPPKRGADMTIAGKTVLVTGASRGIGRALVEEIREAAGQVESLDILINNAGVFLFNDLTDPAAPARHPASTLYAT